MKLPKFATKLDLFIDRPEPVFEILELLKEDSIYFVKKSVANHIADYLKVNPAAVEKLISNWLKPESEYTQMILKYVMRKQKKIKGKTYPDIYKEL